MLQIVNKCRFVREYIVIRSIISRKLTDWPKKGLK